MSKYKNNIISLVLSLIMEIFIWHNFLISGNSIILVLILISNYYFFKKVISNFNKRKDFISIIIGIVFSIIEIICKSINCDFTLNHIIDKWLFVNFLGYAILAWAIISIIYNYFDTRQLDKEKIKNKKNEKLEKLEEFFYSKKSFLVNILLIFIAWIPYFLRYYPGLLTADSCLQIEQAIGLSKLTNHHPIFNTALIALFVNMGKGIFGNINIGVGMYIVFQMIIMAVMFAIILQFINRKQIPLLVKIMALLYYMFYPINALFSVTMWKDVMFAGIVPLFIILCIDLVYNTEDFLKNKINIILYIIVAILTFFMRNNGIYIVLLTAPFIIIYLKKYWKKVIPIFISIFIIFFSVKAILFSILKVKEGSIAEMLSIPLQQIARVKKYNSEELNDNTISRINQFFKCDNIEEKYNPVLSDPVKAELNVEYFNENKIEFIKLWFELLNKYFKTYVESFISNSYGYYYPEATHWVANRTMEPNNMGLKQTPLIKGKLVSKIDSLIERRDIPILSMFFSIGIAFWVIAICLGYKIYKKEYKAILIYMPIFILWLTIIASPVFCEYRYAYPLFTTIPIYLGMNFVKGKEN